MNALVEDQMSRLRKALDSDEVRTYFDSENGLKGNRIYFGRYTSQTIGKKNYDLICEEANNKDNNRIRNSQEEKVAAELQALNEKSENIIKYYNSLSEKEKKQSNKSDAPFISTRLDKKCRTSEMVTRWDMQETPPDIMITNTSMLSTMLMRHAERPIFEKTKEWLKNKSHVFHLIVDELHLYRGTS